MNDPQRVEGRLSRVEAQVESVRDDIHELKTLFRSHLEKMDAILKSMARSAAHMDVLTERITSHIRGETSPVLRWILKFAEHAITATVTALGVAFRIGGHK